LCCCENGVWEEGNAVYRNGNGVWKEGNALYRDGNEVWEEGNAVYRDGNEVWEEGNVIYRDGNEVQRKEENPVFCLYICRKTHNNSFAYNLINLFK
jgi:hypothetical protein